MPLEHSGLRALIAACLASRIVRPKPRCATSPFPARVALYSPAILKRTAMRLDAIKPGNNAAGRHQCRYRSAGRWRTDQVRNGQGVRRTRRRSLPLHADALSGKLRLRSPHAVDGRRSDRRARLQYARDHSRVRSSIAARSACWSWKTMAAATKRSSPYRRTKLTKRYDRVKTYTDLPKIFDRADRALLRPLQGSRARQMGEDRSLGPRRRGQGPDYRSSGACPGLRSNGSADRPSSDAISAAVPLPLARPHCYIGRAVGVALEHPEKT